MIGSQKIWPLLCVTAVVAFLFGALGMVATAQTVWEDSRADKFATSTMDGAQIEQTLYLEDRLRGIEMQLKGIAQTLSDSYDR